MAIGSDIVLGTTSPHWLGVSRCSLKVRQQKWHAAIFGRSESGKSKLLQSIFLQHIKNGTASMVLDPHHDLAFDCLRSLIATGFYNRPDAYNRLIYLDWGNGSYVPFNVLKSNLHPDTVAKNVLDAMMRVWPELRQAPAFQTLFDSGVKCLIANNLPLTYLYQLLVDKQFRQAALTKVTDSLVHQSMGYFDSLGREQPAIVGSTLRRAYLLSSNHLARYTIGQPDNLLDFRKLMDQGVSLLINLGNLGDIETRKLIGALLLVQIEQAATSRTDLLPSQRVPSTVIIDEWPLFAAQEDTISHILSQCRKFGLRLYLAAQSLAQVDSQRLIGALENCKIQISFGLGRYSAEQQSRQIGDVDPHLIKEKVGSGGEGDARSPTMHDQYLSISDQYAVWATELQNMTTRHCYVKLEGKSAVKVKTLPIKEPALDEDLAEQVLTTYKTRYQRTKDEAKAEIEKLEYPGEKHKEPAINQLLKR